MKKVNLAAKELQKWFRDKVSYDGEPYTIDIEQAAAVMDDSMNAIVVARAGSGKTRTLVAKIVYLVAQRKVKPEEIMAFVFNANAAREINGRLAKMRIDGKAVMGEVKIASTFHAFARRIVYDVCGDGKKCGGILATQKELFVEIIVRRMLIEPQWYGKATRFIKGIEYDERSRISEAEFVNLAQMMAIFINRAQQKYLGSIGGFTGAARKYLNKMNTGENDLLEREKLFVEIGVECYKRYHKYLLDYNARTVLATENKEKWILEYGTDFNLIMSWATKIITSGRREVLGMLRDKKYILVDEYQDFSQLFLGVVRAIRTIAVGARLFVVGDDWQAINRFAGSDVDYFRNFEVYFAEGTRRYEISTNYRCDQVIVEAARKFMKRAMKENGSFRAFSRRRGEVMVVNPAETEVGYALVPYDLRVSVEDRILREAAERMGAAVMKKSIVQYLKSVINIVRTNLKLGEIMLLHRNNEMNLGGISLVGLERGLKWGLDRLGVLDSDEFAERIHIMTMHKSKGLESDVVIILEADEGVIPKTHPDTRLYNIFGETDEVALDDQKRLFYVAMTRAKRRLYIMSGGGGFVKYVKKTKKGVDN